MCLMFNSYQLEQARYFHKDVADKQLTVHLSPAVAVKLVF